MKIILTVIACFNFCLSCAQVPVHTGVLYLDDEATQSGLLSGKTAEIKNYLNYLKEEGINVNILIHSKECPRLKLVAIDGKYYFEGPDYVNNGLESSLWWENAPYSLTLQVFPRQAIVYHDGNTETPFWESTEVDFDYPINLQNDKYYCTLNSVLNKVANQNGVNEFLPIIDCNENKVQEVVNSLLELPKLYLNTNYIDTNVFVAKQVFAKTNFCSNLVFYTPYLHTRSTELPIINLIPNSAVSDYALVIATPSQVSEGNVYNNVLFTIANGSGYTDNCYPLLRELNEQDRLNVLYKMHGNKNSGTFSNLADISTGTDFLLANLLSSAEDPVPGNTICDYGSQSPGYNGNQNDYKYISFPNLEFSGPELLVPNSNSNVKWYNDFSSGYGNIVQSCTESAIMAQISGINLQSIVASGCTTKTPQFESSLEDFLSMGLTGTDAAIWLYYDECDDRLYYDIKLSQNFAFGLNTGFGITNPDSIKAVLDAAERLIENILVESAKLQNYSNATLDEGEYPENMHNPELAIFFGLSSTCEGESPWNFGLRNEFQFDAFKLATECLIIIKEILTDQSIPQRLWHPNPSKPCMLDMPGAAAGIIDGCLNLVDGKVWNLTGLLSAAVDFYKADAQTRKDVLKSISNPLNLILGQYPQNLQCIIGAECQEERIYCFCNLFTNAIFDIFGKSIITAVGNISNIGAIVDEKLKMFIPNFDDKYNIWKRGLTEAKQSALHVFMKDISEKSKFKLSKQVTLNKIWEKFDEGLLPGIPKEDLQMFIERLPEHDHLDFYIAFDKTFTNDLNDIKDINKMKDFIEDVNKVAPEQFIEFFSEFPSRYFNAWDVTHSAGKVHLRKNSDFLNTVDEFFDNTITQKFENYGCSLIEEAAIRHYTGGYHFYLNLSLSGANPMTDEFLEFKNTMDLGLNKIPNFSGIVFRGLGEYESNIAMQWQVGQSIESSNWDKKFVSTTLNPEIADDFRLRGGGNVIIKINPCNRGKHIEVLSKFDYEQEIIYPIGQNYRVVEIKPNISNPSVFEITLEEI